MVSAETLTNVGNCALSAGLVLTSGSPAITAAALDELTGVAERTLKTQGDLSVAAIRSGSTAATERTVIETWRDYYVAALAKITDIAIAPAAMDAAIAKAQDRVRNAAETVLKQLGS
jgi:quinol monooxygenase YgiN